MARHDGASRDPGTETPLEQRAEMRQRGGRLRARSLAVGRLGARWRPAAVFLATAIAVILLAAPRPVAATGSASKARVVVALGDSITSGFGLEDPSTESWPAQAQALSDGRYVFVNQGVAGDELATAAGRVSPGWPPMQVRLRAALAHHPWCVVLLGGANDVGIVSVETDEAAIRAMTDTIVAAGSRFAVVTITPLAAPAIRPHGYPAFANRLNSWILQTYPGRTVNYWKYMTGDSGTRMLSALNSGDGIHPNEAAAHWLALHVLALLGSPSI
ncbi:MAG TPA: SGNH/GDSL hydrolase family protein [Acidimicrobiales bacterium]|nr:SGNH/GDSL hydrolase family protein [Acidimicrobiales bacterium]